MLGGNEAYEIGRGWKKLDDVRRDAAALLARIQRAAPRASCLVLGPMDAGVRTVSGEIVPRAHTDEVASAVREVALSNGCAFWDALSSMGGPGAAARWYALDLLHPDLVSARRLARERTLDPPGRDMEAAVVHRALDDVV